MQHRLTPFQFPADPVFNWNWSASAERHSEGIVMNEKPITVRKYSSFDEIKADEYRYWQNRPGHERLDAVEDMIAADRIATVYALCLCAERLGPGRGCTKTTKTFCPPSNHIALSIWCLAVSR